MSTRREIVLDQEHDRTELVCELIELACNPETNVFSLTFRGCLPMHNQSGINLKRFLRANTTLERLTFSSGTYTYNTLMAVAEAMRTNDTLKQLIVYRTPGFEHEDELIQVFAKVLRTGPARPDFSRWAIFIDVGAIDKVPFMVRDPRK